MIDVIALDLEGTLISNAMSQIPRPGLYAFLEECKVITQRVVIYTTVREDRFRDIADLLADEGLVPEWFRNVEYIKWHGGTKDLGLVPNSNVHNSVLFDDFHIYVHPGQEAQWIKIVQFDHPYRSDDNEFQNVLAELKARNA